MIQTIINTTFPSPASCVPCIKQFFVFANCNAGQTVPLGSPTCSDVFTAAQDDLSTVDWGAIVCGNQLVHGWGFVFSGGDPDPTVDIAFVQTNPITTPFPQAVTGPPPQFWVVSAFYSLDNPAGSVAPPGTITAGDAPLWYGAIFQITGPFPEFCMTWYENQPLYTYQLPPPSTTCPDAQTTVTVTYGPVLLGQTIVVTPPTPADFGCTNYGTTVYGSC